MKHIYRTLLVAALLLSSVHTVSAQTTPVKAEVVAKVNALLKERLEKISEAFKDVISNFQRVETKIDAKIAKIKADGKDVTASTAALAAARVKIDAAEAAINAVTSFTASSTNPRGTLKTLKTLNEAARQASADARQSLIVAIKALRADRAAE